MIGRRPAGSSIVIVTLVATFAAGCGGQRATDAPVTGAKTPPPAPFAAGGRLAALGGGRRLYLHCVGSGSPTVVLEAGFPGDSSVWGDVQPQLAETTRTCAYDRAGLGKSSPIPGVHDAGDEIADLQRLLHVAHVQPPYVLVGHSYGGMLVRLFAASFPHETAAVVLVDARGRDATRRQLAVWPKREARAIRRAVFRPVQRGVDLASGEALASRVRSLGDKPLVVITAARHSEWARAVRPQLAHALDRLWSTMQDELAALSSDHVHVVAVRSDHFVQQRLGGQPTVVIRGVRAVVRAARADTGLPLCAHLFSGADVRCSR